MIARTGPSPLPYPLSPSQKAILKLPLEGSLFLEGPAGCGKTTVGIARLLRMLQEGIPSESILVLTPHRPLAEPYLGALRQANRFDQPGSSLATITGLARRAVLRFWKAIAGPAGFASPRHPPNFLNHETAQYILALLVRPLLAQGYFETVTIERSRLYSQILDNLNRAAGVGFPYTEIARRLQAAWTGDAGQLRAFDHLQECAIRFRQFCLSHNLLDTSLLIEIFHQQLWPDPQVQDLLASEIRHLIYDNLEEDIPVSHDILRGWLPRFASALLIYDHHAGYRALSGADPQTAYQLKDSCEQTAALETSFVLGPETETWVESLIIQTPAILAPPSPQRTGIADAVDAQYVDQKVGFASPFSLPVSPFTQHVARFYPEMLAWTASQTSALVYGEGLPPSEIAILAPRLDEALLFALTRSLEQEGVPVRSMRPSRPLRESPAVLCLLTLAALAHPGWFAGQSPSPPPGRYDLAYALVQAIEGMDLVRAQLLAEIVFRLRDGLPVLTSFESIRPDMQARITYPLGDRYQALWEWLEAYKNSLPLDLDEFWSLLLEEVLQQPGFRFASNPAAQQYAANLVDSARHFRQAVTSALPEQRAGRNASRAAPAEPGTFPGERPLGLEFLQLIHNGIAPAQYLRVWQDPGEQAVLIAPAYTFLFANRPVEVQFWLDAGSRAWAERLHQPLTHPYVLSRGWPEQRKWSDEDEVNTARQTLYRLILGLSLRCRRGIYVAASQLSEQGYEQTGPLLRWLQIGMPR